MLFGLCIGVCFVWFMVLFVVHGVFVVYEVFVVYVVIVVLVCLF